MSKSLSLCAAVGGLTSRALRQPQRSSEKPDLAITTSSSVACKGRYSWPGSQATQRERCGTRGAIITLETELELLVVFA